MQPAVDALRSVSNSGPRVPDPITGQPRTATPAHGDAGTITASGYGDPLGMIRDAVVGTGARAGQGATLGFGDEILGGLAAGVQAVNPFSDGSSADAYASARDAVRGEYDKYGRVSPIGATVAELSGAAGAGLAAAPAALSVPLRTGGRLARGTGFGIGIGGATGFGSAEGGFENRLEGAGIGAALGGAGGLGFEFLAPLGRRLAYGAPAPAPRTPEMSAARDLPVEVSLTRGQASNDANLLSREYALARNAEGPDAGALMRGFEDRQADQLLANRGALQEEIAGGAPIVARGEGGAAVSERLNAMRAGEQTRANELYDVARETGAGTAIRSEVALATGQRIADAVRRNHAVENIPGVVREVERLAGYANDGDVPLRVLFETRQRLTSMRATPGEQAVAARSAVAEIDRALDDALELSLLSGDEAGVTAWRNAIGNYRDFSQRWKSADIVGALTRRDPQQGMALKVKPEEAANYILGTADLGMVGKRDMAAGLGRLRDMLGEGSPEWSAIRQEAFVRVADKAIGAQGPNGRAFSGAKLATAWEDFNRKSPEVARRLFTEQERRDIGNWVNVARRVTTKDSRVFNSSGTAYALMSRMGDVVASRIPVVGRFWGIISGQVRDARGRAAAEAALSGVPQAIAAPRSGAPAALLAQPPALGDYRRQ